jgi:AAA domain
MKSPEDVTRDAQEDLAQRFGRGKKPKEEGARADGAGHDKARALKLTYFDECSAIAPKRWLIKGVIALGETSSWIAPPGRGKSALHSEISVHLGAEKNWRGHKTKGRFGVVYFAFERADLVKRRNAAYAKRYGFKGLPIAVASQIIDLMNPKCVDVMLATIRTAEERFGIPVGYVVIDTFAKGIAAGGGDEDKARDQNKCLTNLRRLHERADLHIAIVGHTGKDETRGSRGSNAHPADADLQVQIFGDGDKIKSARVIKGNDQPEGELTAFKLESADLGIDEDGDPITTAILSDAAFKSHPEPSRKLSDRQRLALDALNETICDFGKPAPGSWQLPNGTHVVGADAWRAQLTRIGVIDLDAKNPRQDFKRIRESLAARRLIGQRDSFVWTAQVAA